MRSGTLRHRVEIQVQTDTSDGMGGFTNTWNEAFGMSSVPAAIWPLKAAERMDAMKLELQITHKIRVRYRPEITSKMRIYWRDRDRTFNIVSMLNPDERNIMLEIMAVEEV